MKSYAPRGCLNKKCQSYVRGKKGKDGKGRQVGPCAKKNKGVKHKQCFSDPEPIKKIQKVRKLKISRLKILRLGVFMIRTLRL